MPLCLNQQMLTINWYNFLIQLYQNVKQKLESSTAESFDVKISKTLDSIESKVLLHLYAQLLRVNPQNQECIV